MVRRDEHSIQKMTLMTTMMTIMMKMTKAAIMTMTLTTMPFFYGPSLARGEGKWANLTATPASTSTISSK